MESDLAMVLGLLLGGLGAVSALSAFSDGRRPYTASALLLVCAGLILYAVWARPAAYRLEELPDVFFGVIGRLF
jgi:ABC-type transport system involved in cytochrome c biogenesis permease subunit